MSVIHLQKVSENSGRKKMEHDLFVCKGSPVPFSSRGRDVSTEFFILHTGQLTGMVESQHKLEMERHFYVTFEI